MPEANDCRKAAEESMELAEVLIGRGKISDQDFLELHGPQRRDGGRRRRDVWHVLQNAH